MPKLDPQMLKEIDKSIDIFVKKNKLALENARKVDKIRSDLDGFYRMYMTGEKYVEAIKNRAEKAEKDLKALTERVKKLEKNNR